MILVTTKNESVMMQVLLFPISPEPSGSSLFAPLIYAIQIASISTTAPAGSPTTAKVARAGGSCGKYSA